MKSSLSRTKSRLSLLLVLLTCSAASHACIWYQATTLEGKIISTGGVSRPRGVAQLPNVMILEAREINDFKKNSQYLRKIAEMQPKEILAMPAAAELLPADWPPTLNDAVKPIFTGDFKTAAAMLADLNTKYPNNYYICANLGVTSELLGNDAEALQWVEKAMKIKPDAHFGTEWMHAAVLRAKLAIAKDPKWLETHSISGIPVGHVYAAFSLPGNNGKRIELREIQQALYAHLVPRLLFIKGKDPIVAAMLVELARVEARLISIESGIDMLQLAEEHGATSKDAILAEWKARAQKPAAP